IGDHVTVFPMGYCGTCDICTLGLPRFMCRNLVPYSEGVGEESVVDERHVYRLPESVNLELGALVEPMAVCAHAIAMADLNTESTVVIAGAGPIGTGIFLGLRHL